MKDVEPRIPVDRVVKEREIAYCLASLGYKYLSEIQARTYNMVLNGFSVVLVAPTGSGKTEAALLPILYSIWRKKLEPIAALYITPLRALNRDIVERIERITKCFRLKATLRHGDTPRSLRKTIRASPGHIVVTTPETLQYLIADSMFRKRLCNLRYIVVDEYREMITSKRGIELLSSINIIERMAGRRIVKVALTATLADINKAIELLDNPVYTVSIVSSSVREMDISIKTPRPSNDDVVDGVDPGFKARIDCVRETIERYGHVLVFANTRDLAERLTWGLKELARFKGVSVHHGSLSRQHRVSVEKSFKEKSLRALVATSSLELGIDIGHIDYVVQYMSPRQAVRLIQRIGRSLHRVEGRPRGCIITLDNFYDILESIVLAVRATRGNLEREDIPDKPLDVLAHQIVLRVLIEPGIEIDRLYTEFASNRVFRGLCIEDFNSVIEYLVSSHILRVRENRVYPGRRAKPYFYKVTMIPDTRVVQVIDTSSDRRIGVLNEEFIVLNIVEGSTIVLAGGLWRVVSYDEDSGRLYVEPVSEDTVAIIPRWEGESIPVEYFVAREIGGWLRLYSSGCSLERILGGRVSIDKYSVEKIASVIDSLKRYSYPVPSDRDIIVEVNRSGRIVVFYGFYGSKVANTLKEVIAAVIRKTVYPRVYVYSTPYYIIAYFQDYLVEPRSIDNVIAFLKMLGSSKELFRKYITRVVLESNSYLWRVFYVAQRFGAIDPNSTVRITKSLLKRLSETVIGREALRETLLRDYDLENTYKVLNGLYRGYIRIHIVKTEKPTPLYIEALHRIPGASTVYPIIDINRYRERVLRRRVTTICMMCGYKWSGCVREYIDRGELECPKCGCRYIAVVKGDGAREQSIVLKVLRKERLRGVEKRVFRDLQNRAMLVLDYGLKALTILASRGVGFTEAVRIINKPIDNEEELYRMLYEAEKKYVRIKKYLD